jgi:hypothetical protein
MISKLIKMAKINANKGRGTMIIKEKTKDRKDVEKVLYSGLSGVSREKGDVSDCVYSVKERGQ